jgi:hypothetical protein
VKGWLLGRRFDVEPDVHSSFLGISAVAHLSDSSLSQLPWFFSRPVEPRSQILRRAKV